MRYAQWLLAAGLSLSGPAAATGLEILAGISRPGTGEYGTPQLIAKTGGYQEIAVPFRSPGWQPEPGMKQTWEHWLLLLIPDKPRHEDGAFVFIGNGHTTSKPPAMSSYLRKAVARTGTIGIELTNIPAQPLTYGDGVAREEDSIIAYAWDKYLSTEDPKWIVRGPMLAAARTGLAAAQRYLKQAQGREVRRFVVAGSSKRGWVTWLLPLLEPKIVGIVPMVIDLLNIQPSLRHHKNVYQGFSPALKDYKAFDLTRRFDEKGFAKLAALVDPYSYRQQLKLPKLIFTSGNDPFFLPDSSRFYLPQLQGPSLLRVVPNTGHYLERSPEMDFATLATFVRRVLAGTPLPQLQWHREGAEVHWQASDAKTDATVYTAHNPDGFDFRALGANWPRYQALPVQAGMRRFTPAVPARGCAASVLAATIGTGDDAMTLTSEVFVRCANKRL